MFDPAAALAPALTLAYMTIAVIGYQIALSLTGLVVLPLQLSKNEAFKPKAILLRRSAALAASPGGLAGLAITAYGIYTVSEMRDRMQAMYGNLQNAYQEMGRTSEMKMEMPSIWQSTMNPEMLVPIVIFLLGALMLIPFFRRHWAPYLVLILLSLGYYSLVAVAISDVPGSDNPFIGMFFENLWLYFFAGVFVYFSFFVLFYFLGRMRLQPEKKPKSNSNYTPPPVIPPNF